MSVDRKPRSRRDIQLSFDLVKTWEPMLKGKKKRRKEKKWKK